jgi:iron complex outermembrane receptor protein
MRVRRIDLSVMLLLALPVMATAQTTPGRIGAMTLAELMALEVTTVMRLPQARLEAPASVFVVTQDDIRRSGATTLVDVLRSVPGVHVAQIDGNKWAMGIRGFTDRLARAMLVLIDGRAVYSPLFAGTYWEVQDLPLADIERIEVVRGPGGALWGANAVTGIVNIIRKTAAASQGLNLGLTSGTENPAVIALGFGGSRGATFQYRVSGKLNMRSPQTNPLGLEYDDQQFAQAGARGDWDTSRGAITLQGDVYHAMMGARDTRTTYAPPTSEAVVTDDPLSGGNVLFRWTTRPGDPGSPRLQAYYDRSARTELVFAERQHVADVDFQQGAVRGRHNLLWGGGYRLVAGFTDTSGTLHFTPQNRTDSLVTAFVQDAIRLVPARLSFIAGLKAERNTYSGVEWQPSARLLWTVSQATALSVSAMRAVRTPSRVERDFESGSLLTPAVPTFVRLVPNPSFESERALTYEASLVTMPHPRLSTTVSLFRNEHDNVLSTELGPTFVETDSDGSRVIVPVSFGNGLKGHSAGLEVTADVRAAAWFRFTANYSGLRFFLSRTAGSADLTQEIRAEGGSPRHQVQATATINLPNRVTIDGAFRYVSALPAVDISSYAAPTLRVEWALNDGITLFAVGRDLHRAAHPEFPDGSNGTFGIQRAALVGLRVRR